MCLNFARSPKLFLRSQSVVLARSLGCPPPADECATVSLSLVTYFCVAGFPSPRGNNAFKCSCHFILRRTRRWILWIERYFREEQRHLSLPPPPLPPLLADSTRSRRRKKNEVYTRTFNRGNRYRLEGIYKLGVKSVDGIPTMHSLIRSEK